MNDTRSSRTPTPTRTASRQSDAADWRSVLGALDAVGAVGELGELDEVDPERAARLHRRLSAQAADSGLLDVAYRTVDSPIGALLLATTPLGLVRLAFAIEDHDRVLAELATTLSPRILLAPDRLDAVAGQLEDYFAGRRTRFDVAVDLRLAQGFRREVLEQLRAIAYGATASYAAVAAAAGRPNAVRAVGTACARNPVPVVVPCHRVVRSDGAIGQYRGGVAAKHVLLELEQAA